MATDLAMNTTDTMTERRSWFDFFPEGSLEFVVVTRVLILVTLLSLAALEGVRRDFALLGLAAFIWTDYMLTTWWLIQLKTDLALLPDQSDAQIVRLTPHRGRLLVMVILPITFLMMLVTPWQAALHLSPSSALVGIRIVLLIVLACGLVLGYRALGALELAPPVWRALFLVPLLHWLALHRIVARLNRQLPHTEPEEQPRPSEETSGNVTLFLADISWFLCIFPWLIFIAAMFSQGQWPAGASGRIIPVCSTCLAAVFAVLDIAVMEAVQQRFVTLIRKPE